MQVEVYMDKKREFRWRLKADNGRVMADSGEGYKTRTGFIKALRRLRMEAAAFTDLDRSQSNLWLALGVAIEQARVLCANAKT